MRRLFLALAALAVLWTAPASAQVPCIAVGTVAAVPQFGVYCPQEPSVATYAAAGIGIAPAASATDVACITGATNIVVRLQKLRIGGTAGTAVVVPITLQYHTSADSGGTATTTTALPAPYAIDGGSGTAAKATTTAYTANPTINDATTRQIGVGNVVLPTTSALTGAIPFTEWNWAGQRYMEAPTLRTAAQQVCANFNSISVSSGLVSVAFEWTESAQ